MRTVTECDCLKERLFSGHSTKNGGVNCTESQNSELYKSTLATNTVDYDESLFLGGEIRFL